MTPGGEPGLATATTIRPPGSRLRDLHPGWFASVMGTGIVAVALYDNPGDLTATRGLAHGLGSGVAVLAYVLGAVLLAAYAARWVLHRDAARADLRHPVLGAMLATVPGGLLVLAVMTSVVAPSLMSSRVATGVIAVLAVVGAVLGLVFSVVFAVGLFAGELPPSAVNGGWFIPPVVTVIVPLALVPLMDDVGAEAARSLLVLSYAVYGLGFVLFLLTLGLLHDRLVVHPLPPAALAPTLGIALGPVGVGALAPLALARAGQDTFGAAASSVTTVSQIVALGLWGFGLWWLVVVVSLLARYLRAGALPFHLGWWAFTFPLGAFTVATLTLARAWQAPVLEGVAVVLLVVLLGAWALVAARTVAATRTGAIWRR